MVDIVRGAPYAAMLWWVAIVVYSGWFAGQAESAWLMSFGNSLLNGMIVWLLVTMIRDLRRADAAAIRTVDRLARRGELPGDEARGL